MIGNNEILNYLLIKEDFLPEPTDLGDGKITIGSGLTDSKWIDLYKKRGNKWSKEDNRKAVLEEIQKRRLWAEQNVPHWNSLPESSQDALLSYRYNYNFTPKNSPKLFKALEDKNYLEAARQIDATSKNPDFKKGLLNRRKEEQQWFLSGFPELSKPNGFAIPYKYLAPEYPTAAEAYRKSMAPITDNYSQGGQLQNHKQWKDLSYSEKNDIIKVAVRNGITTLPEIRQKYNEFADEGNLYAGGGYVYDMLPQLFASDGVRVRVTSGYRPNSKVQGSGKPSRHSMHEAADIVGDFSAIRRVLDNPESNTAKWMRANGYGYLDETSKTGTKKFWHDQKGDHSHYHIGKDSGIAKNFAIAGNVSNDNVPIVSSGNYLDIAKAHIRNNEGWSPMPVADGPKNTGWRSVGYGFNDSGFRAKYPQGISKAYENGITKAQAEQELDYILGNMDSHLRRVYGSKWNNFNDNQKAAIIDTYYQRPASVVGRNSAFYNAVMRGDNNAVNYLGVAGYNTRNNDRRKLFSSTDIQIPETTQVVQQPLFYQPWNPQAANLYTPYSPLTSYPAPIFSPEEQEEYFAKQIAQAQKQQEAEQREKQRQEKADRINRFSLLMNLTDPYSSDNSSSSSTPFADAVNMLTQRSPISYFSNGGSIHIKKSNRGKFTRLKERTGHSASWFKENGTPEQKKMAIFDLSSRHWKHGLGGNLFEDGGDTKANIPVTYFTQSEAIPLLADNPNRTAVLDEVTVRPYNKLPMQSALFQGITNQAANEKADEFANRTSLTPKRFLGLMGANVPLAAGALGATVAAPALFDSTVAPISDYITGSSIVGVPTTTWLNTGMEASFAGHGLNHAVNEGIDGWGDAAMTALELAPSGFRSGIGLLNNMNKLRQYSRLEKNYTGVPHKIDKETGLFMDESFPLTHKWHTVWGSDDTDYGRMFTITKDANNKVVLDHNNNVVYGKLYDVYTDPKELSVLDTPEVPEDYMLYWQGLPYKLSNGKITYADRLGITGSEIPKSKEIALNKRNRFGKYDKKDKGLYIWKDGEGNVNIEDWNEVPGAVKTDDVVQYSKKHGMQATRFHKVYDGGVPLDKDGSFNFGLQDYYDYPINELVLNPGAPKYILPHGKPKIQVFNQLPDKFKQPNIPFGYYVAPFNSINYYDKKR